MPEIVSTILQIVLIGIALSMDAFAVSVTQGLIYSDLNKKKGLFIALTYAIFQALFPLIGFFIIELISTIVGSAAGEQAGKIMSVVITYVSFALLIFIGAKMIIEAIKTTLEQTPPELSADIIDNGIMLTGGGAMLRGLELLVAQETGMPVHKAENPLDCVVEGTGVSLETFGRK